MHRLSGFQVVSDIEGVRPDARVYKLQAKPHPDVPQHLDEEPCFCVKYLDLSEAGLSNEEKQRATREAQALLDIEHANIVRYQQVFMHDGRLCCMTEYADGGTLHHRIFRLKEQEQTLPEEEVWHLLIQVCQGLHKLHSCGMIHRALKTRNILLFGETLFNDPKLKYRCKLTDVGIPELLRHRRLSSLSGSSLRYLAPEVLCKRPQDAKVDVWALGCVLYEMATLSHAFNSTSSIQAAEYPVLPDTVSPEIAKLLALMLQPDPALRPSVSEILQLPEITCRLANMPNAAMLEHPKSRWQQRHQSGSRDDDGAPSASAAAAPVAPARIYWSNTEVGSGPSSARPEVKRVHYEPVSRDSCSAEADDLGMRPGLPCWAKHPADGLWHRGMVHEAVDLDCSLVMFTEREPDDSTETSLPFELVWHHDLRMLDEGSSDGALALYSGATPPPYYGAGASVRSSSSMGASLRSSDSLGDAALAAFHPPNTPPDEAEEEAADEEARDLVTLGPEEARELRAAAGHSRGSESRRVSDVSRRSSLSSKACVVS